MSIGPPISKPRDTRVSMSSSPESMMKPRSSGHSQRQDQRSSLLYLRRPKGEWERLFETLQDRLVKELALAEIKSIDEGNRFLVSWIPAFNRRFMVEPASKITSYRKLPNHLALARIFSIQEDRIVKADNTISFKGKMYLISVSAQRASFAKTTVTVHQFVDRTLTHLFIRETSYHTPPHGQNRLGMKRTLLRGNDSLGCPGWYIQT